MVFGIDLPEMKMPDMPGMDLVPGVEKKKEKDPPGEALTPVLENAIKFCSTNGAPPLSLHTTHSAMCSHTQVPKRAFSWSQRRRRPSSRSERMLRQAPAQTHWRRRLWF